MQITNFWHKFYIHSLKIVIGFVIGVCLISTESKAQLPGTLNLPNFDEQKIHFGFLIGGHSSRFRLKYSDEYITHDFDTVHSILPTHKFGFKIGFIVNFHFFQYLDVRVAPTFSFYQLGLDYRYTHGETLNELRDPTYFELPILFKYKSVRRVNRAIYLLAGLTPAVKVSGNKQDLDSSERLLIEKFNLSVDVGVGLDLFQPLFKFSPEVRYSFGLLNVLDSEENDFSVGIENLNIHSFTIYVTFEGGPSTFRRKARKY
ncbi:Outer membrane protein beta-barrel domain-containing protein [Reichenbachiella faecimaris]|uniref:Outer membrane protein beta-barrel domain-containing protein n=1 Tax=Reichenbachiella faecimaris TaxID=692418 RepID=A0A1W2GIG9_REIFA|nr:porin family protein [Reichenbachiella faecimaris]SMD36437.1 Outer membrane protein beta-barrel domain-containing protein [Reichenbachiella faecimaris]